MPNSVSLNQASVMRPTRASTCSSGVGLAIAGGYARYPRPTMSVIEQLVDQIEARFADAEREMSDPEVISDRERYAAAGRTYRQLEPAARLAEEWRRAKSDMEGAQEMLAETEDAE